MKSPGHDSEKIGHIAPIFFHFAVPKARYLLEIEMFLKDHAAVASQSLVACPRMGFPKMGRSDEALDTGFGNVLIFRKTND